MRVLDVAVADAPTRIFNGAFRQATDEEPPLELKPRVLARLLAHYVDAGRWLARVIPWWREKLQLPAFGNVPRETASDQDVALDAVCRKRTNAP